MTETGQRSKTQLDAQSRDNVTRSGMNESQKSFADITNQVHQTAGGQGTAEQERKDSAISTYEDAISYKTLSVVSDATEEVRAESLVGDNSDNDELADYQTLVEATRDKLEIVDPEDPAYLELIAKKGSFTELEGSPRAERKSSQVEVADEFLRNIFIKFGMKKTLESFQTEWYELLAKCQLPIDQMPRIPQIYLRNQELSDELAVLQEELDEARIIAEKARSTYDKLRKQRDYQKINHRRVQQEKIKLNQDGARNKKVQSDLQGEYEMYQRKFEIAMKEKMLIKLEKDRLQAKCDSLDQSLKQIQEENAEKLGGSPGAKSGDKKTEAGSSPKAQGKNKFVLKMTNVYTPLPTTKAVNPAETEDFEPTGHHLSCQKTFKGHLMGVTCLAYNPRKDILATGSDDTTWKLWTVPNGDLVMSGEGHLDWIGGVEFHPRGNLLATCSGDGTVKLWDFMNACCAHTWTEHGQPVWKVGFHHTGDFLASCSMDHTIKLWDLNVEKKSRFTFRGHVDSVNCVEFAPYSDVLVSASGDKTVSLWDIRAQKCVQTFYGHNNSVNSCHFSIKGDQVVSSDSDGICKVWDVRMVKQTHQFDTGLVSANSAKFDKAAASVFVACEDGAIRVFSLESGEKQGELKGHEDAVLDLCWDNSKEGYLISSGSDCSYRMWQ